MNGAGAIVAALAREGVEVVFGYPGGAIMPLYDALLEAPFRHVLMRHEQAAALAADGYARASGQVGVCIATSGPGATNLITGIANARLDSVPLVAITGQVASALMGTDAFQEVDVFGLTLPVVKHSFLPTTTQELAESLTLAFDIARSGRPGPVVIDVPKDVMLAPASTWTPTAVEARQPIVDLAAIERANQLISECQRPLVYAGGGIAMANAIEAFRSFVQRLQVPVVTTLKGLGCVEGDHPLFLGMLGMHGLKSANLAVQECDLLMVIGARFDDRATGKLAEFAPNAKVIHCDIDRAELGKLRVPHLALNDPLTPTLDSLDGPVTNVHWRKRCQNRLQLLRMQPQPRTQGIYAPRFLDSISRHMDPRTTVTCDVGQHQMWVAQHMLFSHPNRHLTSGGLGTMGYGLPAAIGAAFAQPEQPVICVSGDGSLMMNIQELTTLAREQLNVRILLLDNQSLGMVRQWQELFFDQRFSEIDLSDNPHFVDLAKACGVQAERFTGAASEPAILQALLNGKGPFLAHVVIDPRDNVWPLVPPGKPNHIMMEGAKL